MIFLLPEASLLKVLLLSITGTLILILISFIVSDLLISWNYEQTGRRNSSVLQEDEFHKLANITINDLLEKIEVIKAGAFIVSRVLRFTW